MTEPGPEQDLKRSEGRRIASTPRSPLASTGSGSSSPSFASASPPPQNSPQLMSQPLASRHSMPAGGSPHLSRKPSKAAERTFAPLDHVDLAQAAEFHEANFRVLGPGPRSYMRHVLGVRNSSSQNWDYIESEASDFAKSPHLYSLNSDISWRHHGSGGLSALEESGHGGEAHASHSEPLVSYFSGEEVCGTPIDSPFASPPASSFNPSRRPRPGQRISRAASAAGSAAEAPAAAPLQTLSTQELNSRLPGPSPFSPEGPEQPPQPGQLPTRGTRELNVATPDPSPFQRPQGPAQPGSAEGQSGPGLPSRRSTQELNAASPGPSPFQEPQEGSREAGSTSRGASASEPSQSRSSQALGTDVPLSNPTAGSPPVSSFQSRARPPGRPLAATTPSRKPPSGRPLGLKSHSSTRAFAQAPQRAPALPRLATTGHWGGPKAEPPAYVSELEAPASPFAPTAQGENAAESEPALGSLIEVRAGVPQPPNTPPQTATLSPSSSSANRSSPSPPSAPAAQFGHLPMSSFPARTSALGGSGMLPRRLSSFRPPATTPSTPEEQPVAYSGQIVARSRRPQVQLPNAHQPPVSRPESPFKGLSPPHLSSAPQASTPQQGSASLQPRSSPASSSWLPSQPQAGLSSFQSAPKAPHGGRRLTGLVSGSPPQPTNHEPGSPAHIHSTDEDSPTQMSRPSRPIGAHAGPRSGSSWAPAARAPDQEASLAATPKPPGLPRLQTHRSSMPPNPQGLACFESKAHSDPPPASQPAQPLRPPRLHPHMSGSPFPLSSQQEGVPAPGPLQLGSIGSLPRKASGLPFPTPPPTGPTDAPEDPSPLLPSRGSLGSRMSGQLRPAAAPHSNPLQQEAAVSQAHAPTLQPRASGLPLPAASDSSFLPASSRMQGSSLIGSLPSAGFSQALRQPALSAEAGSEPASSGPAQPRLQSRASGFMNLPAVLSSPAGLSLEGPASAGPIERHPGADPGQAGLSSSDALGSAAHEARAQHAAPVRQQDRVFPSSSKTASFGGLELEQSPFAEAGAADPAGPVPPSSPAMPSSAAAAEVVDFASMWGGWGASEPESAFAQHGIPRRSPWDVESSLEAGPSGSIPGDLVPGTAELICHPSLRSPWEVARSFSSSASPNSMDVDGAYLADPVRSTVSAPSASSRGQAAAKAEHTGSWSPHSSSLASISSGGTSLSGQDSALLGARLFMQPWPYQRQSPQKAIVEDADQAIDKATPRAYGKADVFQTPES